MMAIVDFYLIQKKRIGLGMEHDIALCGQFSIWLPSMCCMCLEYMKSSINLLITQPVMGNAFKQCCDFLNISLKQLSMLTYLT